MDEDDALDVINYSYSRRSFILSQQPIFLQKVQALQSKVNL
jgi:hypothetical protein